MNDIRLTQAQEDFSHEAAGFFTESDADRLLFINGLRGQGKSTLAESIALNSDRDHHLLLPYETEGDSFADRFAGDRQHIAVFEEDYDSAEFRQAILETRSHVSGIIVLNTPIYSASDKHQIWAGEQGFTTKSMTAPPLSREDIAVMIGEKRPEFIEHIDLIHGYSLGLPTMVRWITEQESIDETRLRIMLAQHLIHQEAAIKAHSADIRFDTLSEAARKVDLPDVPESLRDEPALSKAGSPLVHANLAAVPHGFPRCQETIGRYQHWMNNHRSDGNIHFTVFAPDVSAKEYAELIETLGLDDYTGVTHNGRIRNVHTGSPIRKIHYLNIDEYFTQITRGQHVNIGARFLARYLEQNEMGTAAVEWQSDNPTIDLKDGAHPLFVYNLGHEVTYQVPVGLAVESELQHRGHRYQINLGGSHFEEYDPQANAYRDLDWQLPEGMEWMSELRNVNEK